MATDMTQNSKKFGGRQVFSIMIACAITWSIGSMMHFLLRTLLYPLTMLTKYGVQMPLTTILRQKITYQKVHFLAMDQVETRRHVFRYMASTCLPIYENECR